MSNELTRFDLAQAFGANPKLIRFFEELISEVKTTSSASPDIQIDVFAAAHYSNMTLIELQMAVRMAESLIQQIQGQAPIYPPEENPLIAIDLTPLERRIKNIEEFLGI